MYTYIYIILYIYETYMYIYIYKKVCDISTKMHHTITISFSKHLKNNKNGIKMLCRICV
jgi:hypothetical protein